MKALSSNNKKLIAVIGATGQQGGGVLRALQARGQFKVRALTRNPDKHRELAEEVVEADVDKPETLKAAFEVRKGSGDRCGQDVSSMQPSSSGSPEESIKESITGLMLS